MDDTAYPTTEETTNASRRNRLLLGPCTDQLRDVLRHEVPPHTFSSIIKQKGSNLPHLNAQQKTLLFPTSGPYSGTYDDMDISLLYTLLRNITNIPPHKRGWNKVPESSDRSVSANIERIRLERNLCVHSPDLSVSNADFNAFWSRCETIISDLDSYLGNGGLYKKETDYLRHVEMDPAIDKKLRQEIRKQAEEEEEIKELIKGIINEFKNTLSMQLQRLESRIDSSENRKIETRLAISESSVNQWKKEDVVFVEPHAFPEIMDKVNKQCIVVFLGGPRCGKKSSMQHIALKLHTQNDFQVVLLDNIDEMETFLNKTVKQLFILYDAAGVWCLDEQGAKMIHSKRGKIQASLLVRNSKLFLTCQRIAYNESKHYMKYFFFDEKYVVDLESKVFALNAQDRKSIFEKHCEVKNLSFTSDMLNDSFEFENKSMFPFLCKLFCSSKQIRDFGIGFFICYNETMAEMFDDIKTENKNQYAVLVTLALSNCTFSEDSFEDSRFSEIMGKVCQACEVCNPPTVWGFIKSLSTYCEVFLKESDGKYQFIDTLIQDILLCHYGRKFITHIISYAPCKFLSTYVRVREEADFKKKDTGVFLPESKFRALSERFLQDIKKNNLSDVFKSTVLQSNIFIDAFINNLQKKTYNEIQLLFLKSPDMRAMTSNWLYPDFKVISWAIFYGHRRIVEFVLNSALENGDSHENVIGKNKTENIRMVKLACFNGNVDMYNSIMRFFSKLEYFHVKPSGRIYDTEISILERKWEYKKQITRIALPVKKKENFYASGFTLMTTACLCGNLPLVKAILNDIDKRRNLFYDCNYVKFKYLLSLNSIYGDNRTPLEAAILSGDCTFVKELIEIGADVDIRTPLYSVMQWDDLELEKMLLENGADICKALEEASLKGNENIVFKILNGRCKEMLKARGMFQSSLDFAFYQSCEGGHFPVIKTLISQGAIINASFANNWTPLHNAIGKNNVELAEYLIDKGSDCNSKEDLLKRTPLHVASQKHLLPIVKLLLKKDPNCNEHDIENCTPLHLAIDPHDTSFNTTAKVPEGLLSLIQTLIDYNADINLCDKNNISPLLSACKRRMWSVAEKLIVNGANVNTYDSSIADFEKTTIRGVAVTERCDDNPRVSPLHLASSDGILSIVEKLIEKGAKVNVCDSSGKTPIHAATENGFLEVVEKLIENGSSCNTPDIIGKPPLIYALKHGHEDIALTFISNGADISCEMALLLASGNGLCLVVEKLIEKGANVNICDSSGKTPIHAATENGFLEVVDKLIENGSACNTPDMNGEPPLIYAVKNGHEDIALKLISNGAVIYSSNENYNSSLIYAFGRGLWNVVEKFSTLGEVSDMYKQCVKCALCTILGEKNKVFKDRIKSCVEILHVVEKLVEIGADVNDCDAFGSFPLCYAVESGFQEVAEKLISHGAKCNQCDKRGRSPLLIAVKVRNEDLCVKLIEHGSNVNLCDENEESPLICASTNGFLHVVEKLIEFGANVNKVDKFGKTPLSCASKNGFLTVVESLIGNGAEIEMTNQKGGSPLFQACENGHLNVVEVLIRNSAKINVRSSERNDLPLHIALKKGNLLIAEKLIDTGADYMICDEEGKSPILIASEKGYFPIVRKLIEKHVNFSKVDDFVYKLLKAASENGHLAVVQILIKHRFDFSHYESKIGDLLLHTIDRGHVFVACKLIELIKNCSNYNTTLHLASSKNYLCVVEKLVKHGADCNKLDKTGSLPLHLAAANGCISIAKHLLSNTADHNIADKTGNFPLHLASKNCHALIVKSLLEHGADCNVNATNKDGLTPLLLASKAEKGISSVVEMLIEHGADFNHCDTNGKSPLYLAVVNGHVSVINTLIQKGADVKKSDNYVLPLLNVVQSACMSDQRKILIFENLTDNGADCNKCDQNGKSPLFIAVEKENVYFVHMLIEHGADINICDKDGKSPSFIATEKGNISILQMLIEHDADINMCDKDGMFPLFIAAERGNISVLQMLIEHGADVNMCDKDGRSAIFIASAIATIPVTRKLLEHCKECNKCGENDNRDVSFAIRIGFIPRSLTNCTEVKICKNYGGCPEYLAIEKEEFFCMQMLIDHGADFNKCDIHGQSPLHFAVKKNKIPSVKMLLDHGADINKCDECGHSPLDIATERDNKIIMQMLIDHGAEVSKKTES